MIQRNVHFWLRVKDRPQWEALKAKGISIADILSQGIQLVYKQEFTKEEENAKHQLSRGSV